MKRLSATTGKTYRMLSESEWEYVARAGTSTTYWWGNTASPDYANYGADDVAGSRNRWKPLSPAPVGLFSANGFGVHDMHGNVGEWVEDCGHWNYEGAPMDGSAWTTGGNCSTRIIRGGSWYDNSRVLRSAYRSWYVTGIHFSGSGFRVAQTLP